MTLSFTTRRSSDLLARRFRPTIISGRIWDYPGCSLIMWERVRERDEADCQDRIECQGWSARRRRRAVSARQADGRSVVASSRAGRWPPPRHWPRLGRNLRARNAQRHWQRHTARRKEPVEDRKSVG